MAQEAFSLTGQHVVVVGASSGIGRAVAVRCAEAGARLSVCARREDRLRDLVSELIGEEHGRQVLDVRDAARIPEVFDGFVAERGPVRGLVYATGIAPLRPINVLTPEHFDDVFRVNLLGAAACTKEAAAAGRADAAGMSIVWISSLAATSPMGAGKLAYGATKAGMLGAVRSLVCEFARRNIRINAVCPQAVKSPIWDTSEMTEEQRQRIVERHPLGMGDPDDVAYACVYLLSPASRWITGSALEMDGGFLAT